MSIRTEIVILNKSSDKDYLKINTSKREINLNARLLKFPDKDTKQIIYYIPAIDITGYGENDEKAIEMLNFSVKEFFAFLENLTRRQLETELYKLGWNKVWYKQKEYSKAHVDAKGELQNFNAIAEEVQLLTVEA